MTIHRILNTEISIAVANNVGTGSNIRCLNNAAANRLLTIANTGGVVATVTIGANEAIIIHKERDETLQGADILAVSVATTG